MRWVAEGDVDTDLEKAVELDGLSSAHLHFKASGTRLGGHDMAMYVSISSYDPVPRPERAQTHPVLRSLVGKHVRVTVEDVSAGAGAAVGAAPAHAPAPAWSVPDQPLPSVAWLEETLRQRHEQRTEEGRRQPGSLRFMSEPEIDRALSIRSEAWARDASILIQEQRAEIAEMTAELNLARHAMGKVAR